MSIRSLIRQLFFRHAHLRPDNECRGFIPRCGTTRKSQRRACFPQRVSLCAEVLEARWAPADVSIADGDVAPLYQAMKDDAPGLAERAGSLLDTFWASANSSRQGMGD